MGAGFLLLRSGEGTGHAGSRPAYAELADRVPDVIPMTFAMSASGGVEWRSHEFTRGGGCRQ